MVHVTIPDQDSFVTYASQTGTGPFTVPFAVFEKADITVLVAGVDVGQAGFSYTATSSTTGGYQTGTITLSASITSKNVTIYRTINPKRTSDLGAGPQNRDALNSALDRIHAQLQDTKRDFGRAPLLPAGVSYTALAAGSAGDILGLAGNGSFTFLKPTDISVIAVDPDWIALLASDPSAVVDNLAGVRFVSTYAALTALVTATGLADNAIYCTYGRTAEEDGGFGFWRYDSGSTATANGGTILAIDGGGAGRFFREDDKTDIKFWTAGKNTDLSTDFTAAAAAARDRGDGVGVVHVPGNKVYNVDSFVSNVANVMFVQEAPRYTGSQLPNWALDGSLYGNATDPAKAGVIIEGGVDTDGSFFPVLFGLRVNPTGDPADYIKGPIYWRGRTDDPSAYSPNVLRDVSALGVGVISTGNMTGRAWALDLIPQCESGADGLYCGLEINCLNQGATQTQNNQTNSKYGLRVFASLGHTTTAIGIEQDPASASNEFEYGLYINPNSINSTGYAILLDGLFAVTPTGATGIGTDTVDAGSTLHLASAGTTKLLIEGDGANQEYVTFRDTGTTAASFGFDNTSGRIRLAFAENLNTPLFEITSAGVLGIGGAVPSGGTLANGIFLKNGTAPSAAPTGGVFIYCVSGIAKVMNTSGVEFPLNT